MTDCYQITVLVLASAFVITSVCLLIAGLVCYNTRNWIPDAIVCQNVYVAGLLMTFLVVAAVLIYMLTFLFDCLFTAAGPTGPVGPIGPVKKVKNPFTVAV